MEFDFSKSEVVEDLNTVPEHLRGAYQPGEGEQEGSFVITDVARPLAEAITGLNTALAKSRKDAKTNKPTSVKELLKPLGVDSIEAAVDLIAGLNTTIEESSEGKVNLDKMRADMQKGFDKLIEGKDLELTGMAGSLNRYLIEKEAVKSIAEAKGVTDLLLPHIKSQTKVLKDGDEFVVRVLDADGEARGDGKGGFMSVSDLVAELKSSPTFGRAFESEAPRGGGTPPRKVPGGKPPGQQADLSPTEKIAAGLSKRATGR